MLKGGNFDGKKSDIWSLGIVLYQMMSYDIYSMNEGIISVNALSQSNYINDILENKCNYYSKELIEMCKSMLKIDYKKRPTTDILLKNPILKYYVDKYNYAIYNRI